MSEPQASTTQPPSEGTPTEPPPKRPRGRPRKPPPAEPIEPKPKRPRGRPKGSKNRPVFKAPTSSGRGVKSTERKSEVESQHEKKEEKTETSSS
ncbi:high mobility group protein HMG-I/HMG-Y [Lingula anatina]|uniref:High mobility group protein HMG-I/HMG-Y n=1 Tax=Lingula anatina TaxID=7574 RepID=A0A1S3J3M7_LINAN|nr:high mobility group protein HMG-I/HMG-Y [Lingula anatina]|eukprot:XP_013404871.1 high mobility group protein HMG-I/HMG-Y [Lingula anatina]